MVKSSHSPVGIPFTAHTENELYGKKIHMMIYAVLTKNSRRSRSRSSSRGPWHDDNAAYHSRSRSGSRGPWHDDNVAYHGRSRSRSGSRGPWYNDNAAYHSRSRSRSGSRGPWYNDNAVYHSRSRSGRHSNRTSVGSRRSGRRGSNRRHSV